VDWPSDSEASDRLVFWQWIESHHENIHQKLCRSIGRRFRGEGISLTVLVGMRSNPSCASKETWRRRKEGWTVCAVMIPLLGVSLSLVTSTVTVQYVQLRI
jgi:hypothetical protein